MTAHTHEAFEHVAILHRGPAELAERVAPGVTAATENGAAVLVCLDQDAADHLARAIGPAWHAVTYVPAGVRYARPSGAMAMVHRFATDALAAGASSVLSLGAIGFDGTDADERWIRYEAAVNDVLRHLPFRGICGYDTATLTPELVELALATHALVHDQHGVVTSPAFGSISTDRRRSFDATALGVPDQRVVIDEPSAARRALTSAYAGLATRLQLDDALLTATELATNGLRHGAPPVVLESWRTGAGDLVLRVSDAGPGIADPYADLRPPEVDVGGYGLWLVGQMCDDVVVERIEERTVVTARIGPAVPPLP